MNQPRVAPKDYIFAGSHHWIWYAGRVIQVYVTAVHLQFNWERDEEVRIIEWRSVDKVGGIRRFFQVVLAVLSFGLCFVGANAYEDTCTLDEFVKSLV